MADDTNEPAIDNSGLDSPPAKRGRPRRPKPPGDGAGNIAGGSAGGTGGTESLETVAGPVAGTAGSDTGTTGPDTAPDAPEAVRPESIASGEAPRKKRGRPPGSGTGGTRTKAETVEALSVKETANEIAGVYWMISQITRNEMFDIGLDRAMMIAKPLADVSKYYPIKTNGPAISIAKLAAGIAAVNLPILIALAATRAQARAARRPAATPATPDVIVPGATEARAPYDFSGVNGPQN